MPRLGRPVIVYVPYRDTEADKKDYDRRARVFAEIHPLSLQVNQMAGDTNGITLVRDANQRTDVLYAIARNQLQVTVSREIESDPSTGETSFYWVLREEVSGNNSVIPLATGWKHLRNGFLGNLQARPSHPVRKRF